jgi:hypothetical protein
VEVGHDDGNLQSITGGEPRTARDLFARNIFAQELSKQALLAESRSQRLTPLPP